MSIRVPGRGPAVRRALASALAIPILLAACGSSVPNPSAAAVGTAGPAESPTLVPSPSATEGPSPSQSPEPSPTPTPVPTPVLVAAPLTGLLVDPKAARRHPIAVMIDDLSPARPQSGFSAASIVWQAPAEGGIPRYMMVFGENRPGAVGPVRSSRYYYIAWAAEWRAVYAHAGGSPQALATLRSKGRGQLVYNADEFGHARAFNRVSTRFPPHNLYTDGKRLDALGASLGAKPADYRPVWTFAPDAPLESRPVGGKIDFRYPTSAIHYDYDRKTNTYLRTVSVEGKQRDAATKKRVAPKNVIVMLMRFGPLNDGSHKHRLEANVVGSGPAWISTNGRTIKGTWRKKALTAPTLFFDGAGKPVTLTAGQTFINVLPTGSAVRIVKGAPPPPAPSPSPSGAPSPSPSGVTRVARVA